MDLSKISQQTELETIAAKVSTESLLSLNQATDLVERYGEDLAVKIASFASVGGEYGAITWILEEDSRWAEEDRRTQLSRLLPKIK